MATEKITLKDKQTGNPAYPYTSDEMVKRTGGTNVKNTLNSLEERVASTDDQLTTLGTRINAEASARQAADSLKVNKSDVQDISTVAEAMVSTTNPISAHAMGVMKQYVDADKASKSYVNDRLNTQDQKINLLDGHEVVVVPDHTAVTNPDPQKIYREPGDDSYTDWMYQGSTWHEMAEYPVPLGTDAVFDENLNKTQEEVNEEVFVHNKNYADYAVLVDGRYISAQGVVNYDANTKSVKFPCKSSTTYTISKIKSGRFRIAYFNTEPVIPIQGSGVISNANADSITITTASDSIYLFIWVYDSTYASTPTIEAIMASLQIEESSVATEYVTPGFFPKNEIVMEHISEIEGSIDNLDDRINVLDDRINVLEQNPTNFSLKEPLPEPERGGYWVLSTGVGSIAIKSPDSTYYTWQAQINKGDVCLFYTKHSNSGYARSCCLTDGNYKILQQGWVEDDESQDSLVTPICLIAQEDGYALMNFSTAYVSDLDKCALNVFSGTKTYNNKNVTIDELLGVDNVLNVDASTGLVKISDNPLHYLLQGTSYASIIHDWGVIGASWDSGEFHYKKNGEASLSFEDCYEYSWGKVFARLNGVNLYNYSNGGQTTRGWIIGGSALVGDDGGGGWEKAQESPKQAYIINLCGNDATQIDNYESDPTTGYPIGDVSTDIAENYENNASTYVGYYAGIVQRLKSIQPDAKIFIATMALSYDSTHLRLIQEAKEIYQYFKILYPDSIFLLDFASYKDAWFDNTRPLLNTHGTAAAYMYLGYVVNTYIDWVVRKNLASFKNSGIIGKGTIS